MSAFGPLFDVRWRMLGGHSPEPVCERRPSSAVSNKTLEKSSRPCVGFYQT